MPEQRATYTVDQEAGILPAAVLDAVNQGAREVDVTFCAEALRATVSTLAKENAALAREIAALRRRIDLGLAALSGVAEGL